MKVVILAGGLGARIAEESVVKPKPLVEIGGKPMTIWHIMKHLFKIWIEYGFINDTCMWLSRGCLIKEYFTNYYSAHY